MQKLKIALVGYGQMGKILERMAPEHGCEVVAIIDPYQEGYPSEITPETLKDAEVCIEFTQPDAVIGNMKAIAACGRNMVVGTTGWKPEDVRIDGTKIGMVYGSNFSVGMNAMYLIVEAAANVMNALPEYDPYGYELHHKLKKDSPSGTARTLAGILLENIDRKDRALYDCIERKIEPEELHFSSTRAGNIPGEHVIGFDSAADSIQIVHTARNREGLALGAIKAAKWIAGKKGVHDFRAIFRELVK